MLYWAQLLHFYQPPTQSYDWLVRICEESYRPLLRVLHAHPHARVSVNINGVLLDLLHEHGMDDVIESLRALVERGQVELTGTGKYHPILPLLPHAEQVRQIALDRATKHRFLGAALAPRGFFPPELAYDASILPAVHETDHAWLLLAGIAHAGAWPTHHIDRVAIEGAALAVFYRDDILSNRISFRSLDAAGFVAQLEALAPADGDAYVVTAMDAETYGHHIPGWERAFLDTVYAALRPTPAPGAVAHAAAPDDRAGGGSTAARHASAEGAGHARVDGPTASPRAAPAAPALQALAHTAALPATQAGHAAAPWDGATGSGRRVVAVQISDLLDRFPVAEAPPPHASSWSTSDADLRAGNPFPLWLAPDNALHQLQWEHLQLAIELVEAAERLADTEPAREAAALARRLLDEAEHSCQMWWASRRPWWGPTLIVKGLLAQAETLVNAYRAIDASTASPTRKRALHRRLVVGRDLRDRIVDSLFTTT